MTCVLALGVPDHRPGRPGKRTARGAGAGLTWPWGMKTPVLTILFSLTPTGGGSADRPAALRKDPSRSSPHRPGNRGARSATTRRRQLTRPQYRAIVVAHSVAGRPVCRFEDRSGSHLQSTGSQPWAGTPREPESRAVGRRHADGTQEPSPPGPRGRLHRSPKIHPKSRLRGPVADHLKSRRR